jgi:PAP2 superfamily
MWLSWNAAAVISICLAALGLGLPTRDVRWRVGTKAVAREASVVVGLYSIWQLAGTLSLMKVTGAMERARWIWDAERSLHLPSELAMQRAALPHPLLVEACNRYYAVVHGPALIACLLWLFARHRDQYPRTRNAIALVTGACLAIQLIPVAPPRMLDHVGFVDTGLLYHQSVYTAVGRGMADQLSAMPSVHVAWAVLIAMVVIGSSSSRWRWAVLVHPAMTAVVVAITGNHFWLDGVVAVALIPPALAVLRAATGLSHHQLSRRAALAPAVLER